MNLETEINAFWKRFCFVKGVPETAQWQDCFHFELTRGAANHLLGLVMAGVKQATCSSLFSFQTLQLRPPRRGDLSIVTDWDGVPHCVILTTGVTIIPYREVTWAQAMREGEDDTLEGWRVSHRNFFMAEGSQLGYVFSPDMPVVFEDFRVVYQEDEL